MSTQRAFICTACVHSNNGEQRNGTMCLCLCLSLCVCGAVYVYYYSWAKYTESFATFYYIRQFILCKASHVAHIAHLLYEFTKEKDFAFDQVSSCAAAFFFIRRAHGKRELKKKPFCSRSFLVEPHSYDVTYKNLSHTYTQTHYKSQETLYTHYNQVIVKACIWLNIRWTIQTTESCYTNLPANIFFFNSDVIVIVILCLAYFYSYTFVKVFSTAWHYK